MHLLLAILAVARFAPAAPGYPAGAAAFIDAGRIPVGARAAWEAARTREEAAAEWAPEWRHAEPRAAVAKVLDDSLKVLNKGRQADPRNVELLLAIGLTGRWAHNVDVEGAFDLAVAALEKARDAAVGDPRPDWFLGTNLCQSSSGTVRGMRLLLAVEQGAASRLPTLFWRDYADCAGKTHMPAHALRGHEQLLQAAEATPYDRKRVEALRKVLIRASLDGEIATNEAWAALQAGESASFRSLPCGFVMRVKGSDKIALPPAQNGACAARVTSGPFDGKQGPVSPSITVLARVGKPGETLAGVLAAIATGGGPGPARLCPAPACLRAEADRPDLYREEGGGLLVFTVLERTEPTLPGLVFEEPQAPAAPASSEGTQFYRPSYGPGRYPGTIYYTIFLDTPRSVLPRAQAAYEAFLRELRVE